MYQQKLNEAKAKAATFADKLRKMPTDIQESDWKDITVKLTEANVEVERLSGLQREHDSATEIASRYLDPDPNKRVATKASDETASAGKRKEQLSEMYAEASAAFYRSGGDVAAARRVLATRGAQPNEIATLIAADSTRGGILVMPELGQQRTNRIPPPVMRSICDVQSTVSDTLVIPLINTELETPNITPEGYEHTTRQDVTMGGVEIKIFDWHPKPIVVSQKLLRNAGAQVVSIINDRIEHRKNLDEDEMFINGDGAGEPYGLMNETITSVNTQHATQLTWAGILNWIYTVPEAYANGAEALMRRLTYAAVLGTADPAGHYVFALSSQVAPNTILGYKVNFSGSMPAIAADAYPAIIGWFGAYTVVDGPGGMTVKRLEEKFDPNVGFSVLALLGGRCVEPTAFVKLKVSV